MNKCPELEIVECANKQEEWNHKRTRMAVFKLYGMSQPTGFWREYTGMVWKPDSTHFTTISGVSTGGKKLSISFNDQCFDKYDIKPGTEESPVPFIVELWQPIPSRFLIYINIYLEVEDGGKVEQVRMEEATSEEYDRLMHDRKDKMYLLNSRGEVWMISQGAICQYPTTLLPHIPPPKSRTSNVHTIETCGNCMERARIYAQLPDSEIPEEYMETVVRLRAIWRRENSPVITEKLTQN